MKLRFFPLCPAFALVAAGLTNAEQSATLNPAVPSQLETRPLAFEVVSIKPSDRTAPNACFIKGQPGGQTFVGSCITLRMLIKYAYRITDSQLDRGPDWLDSEFYDFDAKADHSLTRDELPPHLPIAAGRPVPSKISSRNPRLARACALPGQERREDGVE